MIGSTWLAAAFSLGICTASFAQISGKVTLLGTPPEMKQIKAMAVMPQCAQLHKDPVYEETVVAGDKGELANVIVFLKEVKPGDLKGPQNDKPAKLDQKGCMYSPHVLAVQVGQPVVVANSDPFLHNVHCEAVANKAFNIVQVNVGENKLDPFTVEETFTIKCDVHPWMQAYWLVLDNPYFAVTDDRGNFEIKNAPAGTQKIVVWQEATGYVTAPSGEDVNIKAGDGTSKDFTIDPSKVKPAK